MSAGITVTRRIVPGSQRTNEGGSKIGAHAVITMETSLAFLRSQGDFQKNCFFNDGLAKYDVSAGCLFVVSTFS